MSLFGETDYPDDDDYDLDNDMYFETQNYFFCCAISEVTGINSTDTPEDFKNKQEGWNHYGGAYTFTGVVGQQDKQIKTLLDSGWKEILEFESRETRGLMIKMLAYVCPKRPAPKPPTPKKKRIV